MKDEASDATNEQKPKLKTSQDPESLVVKICDTNGEEHQLEVARREAALLKKLDHEAINKFVDFYEDPIVNKTYLVLEHAGNKSLEDFVQEHVVDRGKKLSEETVRDLMMQFFVAVSYLHANYICHRDLKPDNLIISDIEMIADKEIAPKVKVIDFNVAVEVSKTNPRIRGGTGLREWSAPETYRSTYSDFKIDSWTLGCVMYLLCTGN